MSNSYACLSCLLVALAAAAGCSSCPDLDFPALNVNLEGTAGGAAAILFDVEPVDAKGQAEGDAQRALDLVGEGVPDFAAGRYRIIAKREGNEIGRIEDVCTVGRRNGCDAEKYAASDAPVITLDYGNGTPSVALTSNGRCP